MEFLKRISGRILGNIYIRPDSGFCDAPPDNGDTDNASESSYGAKILFEALNPQIDIIAIHGLNGHRTETWTTKNRVLWLKDLLPNKVQTARIITYGYDARTHGHDELSQQSISGHAREFLRAIAAFREDTDSVRRPIIFVAHSLGGLVLKCALTQAAMFNANHLDDQKAVKISTYGIIFLGTPHEGSKAVSLAGCLMNIAKIYYHTTPRISEDLQEHSKWLDDQNEGYKSIIRDFDTVFCVEEYATPVIGGKSLVIVPKWSASISGAVNFPIAVIHKNHIEMVKYESSTDSDYDTVSRYISQMAGRAEAKIERNWAESRLVTQSVPKSLVTVRDMQTLFKTDEFRVPSNLPLRNDNFVGRHEPLQSLQDRVFRDHGKTHVLYGPGGYGKSEIALQYAWSQRSQFTTVFWLDASNLESLRASFLVIANKLVAYYTSQLPSNVPPYASIAEALDLKGLIGPDGQVTDKQETPDLIASAVKSWLNLERNIRWLLIFDSYDDPESFLLQKYLPTALSGTTIITTSLRECARLGQGLKIELPSTSESLQLLLQSAQISGDLSSTDNAQALLIVDKLDRMPLAIDHAGSYIFNEDIPLSDYLPRLEKNTQEVLSKRPAFYVSQYTESVFTTWEASYSAVQVKDTVATRILVTASFYSYHDVPIEIFQRGMAVKDKDIESGVSTLLAYSLVKRANIGSISIHSLIHMWARERFSREEQADKSYEALGVMADAVRLENEYTRSNADWVFERKAMLHTQLSLSKALKFWPQRQLRETEILQFRDIALLFQLHGKYTEAELQYNRALQSAATLYGGGDFRILEIELGLAKVYRLQHRILEAKERYQNCIAGFGRSLPPLAVQNLLSKEGLATTLHDESNFREAKELHEEAITGLKLVLGEGHPETLLAMGNLATTLLRQINYKEAEILYRDILEMSTGQSGEAHFNSLRIRQNLALCLEMQDRLDEARLEYDILVGLRKEMLGIDHPSTLRVMQNLAWVHYRQEDFKGAENLYGAVVAGREKVLGVNHFDTLRAVRNMAKVLIASGQSDKARPYLTRALDGFQAQSESICGDYVDSVKRALKQLGKLSEAQLPANDPASFQTKAGIVEM